MSQLARTHELCIDANITVLRGNDQKAVANFHDTRTVAVGSTTVEQAPDRGSGAWPRQSTERSGSGRELPRGSAGAGTGGTGAPVTGSGSWPT